MSEQTRFIVFDASTMAYDENVTATAAIVQLCHEGGLDAEAELGEIGGKDGVHAAGARTRPEEARAFATATGVHALAVAVGTSHAMTERSRCARSRTDQRASGSGPGALGVARFLRRSRSGTGPGDRGWHDQDQHRDSSQPGFQRVRAGDAGCLSGHVR